MREINHPVPRLLFIPLFAVALLWLQGCAKPPYTNVDNEQLQALLAQGVRLYDIRRPDEWKMLGVIKGSHRLTFVDRSGRLMPDFLPRFTGTVGKDDPVVLICHVGNRSATLARYLMEEQGYTNVYNVDDGIRGWLADRLPVVGRRGR